MQSSGLPRAMVGKPSPQEIPAPESQSSTSGSESNSEGSQASSLLTPLLSQGTERELQEMLKKDFHCYVGELEAAFERAHPSVSKKPGLPKLKRLTSSQHWISGWRRAPAKRPPDVSHRALTREAKHKICSQLAIRGMILTNNGFRALSAGVRKFERAWAQALGEEMFNPPGAPQPDLARPPPIPLYRDEVLLEAVGHVARKSARALSLFTEEVIRDVIFLAERKGTKVANVMHVLRALKACGRKLFVNPI